MCVGGGGCIEKDSVASKVHTKESENNKLSFNDFMMTSCLMSLSALFRLYENVSKKYLAMQRIH